jgi:hypothetical protein
MAPAKEVPNDEYDPHANFSHPQEIDFANLLLKGECSAESEISRLAEERTACQFLLLGP